MPSEKKSKKNKAEQKATTSNEPLKPLSNYVGDRLELTKQLFSCLKNKQVKQRLPPNLQNKSIERIQQICLDEILGISSKRLVSIINNARCPDNTDSDSDAEVEQLDEHISLEEISSDSEAEASSQSKPKEAAKKKEPTSKKSKDQPKTPKEMTMLELLELQARARAIRSQLALEPVTKIELNSDDEEEEAGKSAGNKNAPTRSNNSVNSKSKEQKVSANVKKPENAAKLPLRNIIAQTVRRLEPPPPPPKTAPIQSAKPVKLKRNYKKQTVEDSSTPNVNAEKEKSPPKVVVALQLDHIKDDDDDDRCSSPDVITMDPSPETFFISDSEEEEPPMKKSPEKKETTPVKEVKILLEPPQPPEEGELSENSTRENSTEADCEKASTAPLAPDLGENQRSMLIDEDVVHLMSDNEIELHHQEEEETEASSAVAEKKTEDKAQEHQKITPESRPSVQSDDDVVEINNSSDDDMMNESEKSTGETSKTSQTWEDRWLSSSKTQNILKTTKFESKLRNNMLKTKKSQKANEKKKEESEKVVKEKVSTLEEGSMEQFKIISSNN